ncbi:MAG: M48 family metalloprotease, partial [Robiginitomaculum sp.]
EEMLSDFAKPLIGAAGLNAKSVDMYIVNDPTLNAFVTRGQKVFLHTGIIIEFESPDQLKGVVAHEIGHISSGHLARSGQTTRGAYGTMLVAAGLGIAAMLAGEGRAGAAILGSSSTFATLDVLKYTRINEASADQAGALYLENTGQTGQGLIEFFEKFRYQEVMSQQGRFPYFRSHPLSSARIDSLREVVGESPFYETTSSDEDIHRLSIAQAKLRGFIEPPQSIFNSYPASDTSEQARLARSVAHFRAADLVNALRNIDSLIKEFPQNPYYHELKGQIYFESGRAELALPSLRKAIALKSNAPLLQMALGQALITTKPLGAERQTRLNEGITYIKKTLQSEPENGFAWYLLSQAYGEQDKPALAKYAVAEQAYASGNLHRASEFATRALLGLERDTPQYRRANDIKVIATARMSDARR